MDNREDGDSIEEIRLVRNTLFGNKVSSHDTDLMRGIIINVRTGKIIKNSKNTLISMLEKLLSQTSAEEKKRVLAEEYGMIMTTELEGRIRTMYNLSENILDRGIEEGRAEGQELGELKKQTEIIINMLKNNLPCQKISEMTGIPLDIVEEAERSMLSH